MHGHSDDIFVVKIEEFLLLGLFAVNNTNTSRCEDNTSISRISQVASCVEAAESMSPLEGECIVRGFSHISCEFEIVWYACFNLSTPHVHAASLVTLIHLDFAKILIITACVSIFVLGASVFIEDFLVVLLSDSC